MRTKDAILAEIERSRRAIARDFVQTSEAVDPRVQAARVYARSPYLFLGAAVALGWVIAGPRRVRRGPAVRERAGAAKQRPRKGGGVIGLVLGLFRLVVPILKPALSAYAAKRLSELAKGF